MKGEEDSRHVQRRFCALTTSKCPHSVVAAAVSVGVSGAHYIAAVGLNVTVYLASIVSAPALTTVLQTKVGEVLADGGAALGKSCTRYVIRHVRRASSYRWVVNAEILTVLE